MVDYALRSFERGATNAAREQVFAMWKKYAQHAKEIARNKQSVHDALLKSLMGEPMIPPIHS